MYGKTKNNASLKTHPKTGQAVDPKIRFQGQWEDVETGLYQNLHRFYDPHAGRYLNHDPIGLMGGLNAYQYCPNPVGWVDPLGLSCKEIPVGGGYLRDSRTIQFSQNTVNSKFEDGSSLNDLVWHFKNDPYFASTVEPIRLIKFSDLPKLVQLKLSDQGVSEYSVFTLDNRRLYAARQAKVNVNSRWATPDELAQIDLDKRFSTKGWHYPADLMGQPEHREEPMSKAKSFENTAG